MLRDNKSFQFLIGCLVLVAAYKMFTLGVFDFLIRDDSEGFESTALIPMVISALVSAVQMVGLIAILLVSGLAPYAEKSVDFLRDRIPRLDKVASKVESEIDSEKLINVLNKLDERIRSIEIKVGEDKTVD
jgi:hypothetical protein